MKNQLLLLNALFISSWLSAQNIEAHYRLIKPSSVPISSTETINSETEYEGVLYRSGSKAITYLVPQYLQQYPTGKILVYSKGTVSSYKLRSTDSMQAIDVYEVDSLISWWTCNNMSFSRPRDYIKGVYRPGYIKWVELNDTKVIKGLKCKKMQVLFPGGGGVMFEGWVHKEIAAGFGLYGLRDVPGIILEGSMPLNNLSYSLTSLKLNEPIADKVFWPDLFKRAQFIDYGKRDGKKQEMEKKKVDIMNQ